MRIKAMIIVLFLLLPNVTLAEIKYNAMIGQWESSPSDGQLKYNPFDGDWTYERSGSDLEYNPLQEIGNTKDNQRLLGVGKTHPEIAIKYSFFTKFFFE